MAGKKIDRFVADTKAINALKRKLAGAINEYIGRYEDKAAVRRKLKMSEEKFAQLCKGEIVNNFTIEYLIDLIGRTGMKVDIVVS